MAAQLPAPPFDVPAGSPQGEPAACTGRASMADGFALAVRLVADPYSAAAYDSPSLLRAGAALRTMYGGQHPEPRHHAAMRHAEDTAAAVVRIRLAADAAAQPATLPAGGPAPRIRPMAPAPTGAPGAPAAAAPDRFNAELEKLAAKRTAAVAASAASRPAAWGAGSADDL